MLFLKKLSILIFLCLPLCLPGQGSHSKLKLIPYNNSGDWGFSDTLGNIVLAGKYDSVGLFHKFPGGLILARIHRNNKSGLIAEDGTKFFRAKYDQIEFKNIRSSHRYFKTTKNKTQALYNFKGRSKILKGREILYANSSYPYLAIKRGKTFRLFNIDKKKFTPEKYYHISTSKASGFTPRVGKRNLTNSLVIEKEDGSLGVIRTDTTYWFSKSHVDSIYPLIAIEEARIKKVRAAYTIEVPKKLSELIHKYSLDSVDQNKSVKHRPTHSYAYLYGYKNGREVVIDVIKDEVVEFTNSSILDIHNYWFSAGEIFAQDSSLRVLFTVKKGKRMGILRRDGKVILPLEYDNLIMDKTAWLRYLLLEKDGKFGLKMMCCDMPAIEPIYDSIRKADFLWLGNRRFKMLFMVSKDGNYGYIDDEGTTFFKW